MLHIDELGYIETEPAKVPARAPARQTLSLPPCPQRLEQLRRYLILERRLPSHLLEVLFQSGDLYADARANAVFVLRATDGRPVGAELRGTSSSPWRGMAPGSRKDHGYIALPNASMQDILLCESAIDAIIRDRLAEAAAVLHLRQLYSSL